MSITRTMTWFRSGCRARPSHYRAFVLLCGINRAWAQPETPVLSRAVTRRHV